MNRFQLLLCLLFVLKTLVFSEEFSGNWGSDTVFENNNEMIPLYNLSGWQIASDQNPTAQSVILPFFADNLDTLIFTNEFEFPANLPLNKLYFRSLGFKGNVEVYINDRLCSKYPNGSQPFKTEILKSISLSAKNSIKIVLTKSADYIHSFPVMTHILTEPEYIGITRPFFLEWDSNSFFIDDFKYKIARNENELIATYSFKIPVEYFDSIEKIEGYTFSEVLTDDIGTVLFKKEILLSKIDNVIKRELVIPAENLWSPENPRFIHLSLTAKRYGNPTNQANYSTGLRQIGSGNNLINLNFLKIPVKGINYYENLRTYLQFDPVQYKVENLSAIKKDGFNAIRFVAHIPDERYLNIADSLGLLLFLDLPVKRLPIEAFQSDELLENIKNTLLSIINTYKSHPSFAGIGLGQEILLNEPASQKFFIILNGSIARPVPFLTYLSPVDQKLQSKEMAADFYMADFYRSLSEKYEYLKSSNVPYLLAGKIGLYSYADYLNTNADNYAINRKSLLLNDVNALYKLNYQGGFLECFMDWYSLSGYHQTINNANPKLINSGLYDLNGEKKAWARDIEKSIWEQNVQLPLSSSIHKRTTNIFSITMFFGSLFFMFFYRRYPRLSENYRRALKHPYGFYVDMRERRIIPLFNSLAVGLHNSLILATFIGSFVFYWNNSILAQEFLKVIVNDNALFEWIVRISQNEFKILAVLFCLVFLHPILMGIILKIYGIFTKNSVRLRQSLAIGLWSGAPFIFMLPLSIGAYHLISNHFFIDILLYIFVFFIIWVNFRLANGIRVLVFAKFSTIFILLLLSYILPLVIFFYVFTPQPMWTDYLITLLHSYSLF